MNAKKAARCLAAVCAVIGITGTTAYSQDADVPAISTKLDTAYVSKYIWRGIPQTADGAVQPSITVTHDSGLSFNFWASEDNKAGKVTENDYTLNYSWTAKKAGMNAGLIYYAFPNTSYKSTSELYASACFNGLLSPTLSLNYDVDEANGYYASIGGGYACAMPWSKEKPTNLNLSAKLSFSSASYNKFWFGVDKFAISDLYLSASVPVTLAGKISMTPSLSYSMLINHDLRNAVATLGKPDNLVGALNFSYAF